MKKMDQKYVIEKKNRRKIAKSSHYLASFFLCQNKDFQNPQLPIWILKKFFKYLSTLHEETPQTYPNSKSSRSFCYLFQYS
jgi:hypothetical protein